MIALLILFIHVVMSPLKAKARLEAEIIVLRHQLNILHRRVSPKPKLAASDRLLFVWLYRPFPSVLNAVRIIQPDTVVGGIGRAFDCIGAGSRALGAVGRRYPGKSAT
jgi:putative transposase